MAYFILFLFFLFFIFPAILRFFLRLAAKRMTRKFSQFAGQGFNNYQNPRNEEAQPQTQKHKKIFSQNDGEYVQFEEIKEERTIATDSNDSTFVDDRITDVKFEEIKD